MTRWIHRHKAFEKFVQFYEVVVDVLEDIRHSQGWNKDTVTDATTITVFQLFIGFVVARKALTLVKPLSISLQLSSIDVCKAYQYVSKTRKSVQHVCDNVDDFSSK